MPSAEELAKVLDELGTRIGPYGDAAWTIVVSGERAEGVIVIGGALLMLIPAFMALRIALDGRRRHAEASGPYREGDDAMMIGGAVSLSIFFAAVVFAGHGLLSVLAPEYVVLRDLLEGFR